MSECNAFDGVNKYFTMKFYSVFLAAVFVFKFLTSQVIALDEDWLSRLVLIRYHRRLRGFTFNTVHSASLVYCALQCRRNPRCFSTNFRKALALEETDGICELNDRGVMLPQAIVGRELVQDEETVYSQFYDRKVRKMCYYEMQNKTMLCAHKVLGSFATTAARPTLIKNFFIFYEMRDFAILQTF